MSTLQIVLGMLRTLAILATNPALGLSKDGVKVAGLINLIVALGEEGQKASDALTALDAEIKALDTAGGPIPDSVWAEWDGRHAAAQARLAAA